MRQQVLDPKILENKKIHTMLKIYIGKLKKFFSNIFFLLFSSRTASGGAQGAAANGAVEGQKPSGPPSVRHIKIGQMPFWRSIFICMSFAFSQNNYETSNISLTHTVV